VRTVKPFRWAAGVVLAAFSLVADAHWVQYGSTIGTPADCSGGDQREIEFNGTWYVSGAAESAIVSAHNDHGHGYVIFDWNQSGGTLFHRVAYYSDTHEPPPSSVRNNETHSTRCAAPPAGTPPIGTDYSGLYFSTSDPFDQSDIGTRKNCASYQGQGSWEVVVSGVESIEFEGEPAAQLASYEYTGEVCSTPDSGASASPLTDINPDAQVVEEGVCATGNVTSCVSEDEKNCGWVNGTRYCAGDGVGQLSDSNPCVQNANGSFFCLESASASLKPDNGTAGNPATASAENTHATAEGSDGVQYFSSSTVANSTNYGTGPDSGSGDGNSDNEASCGAPGQPACQIDESGTPSSGNFGPAESAADGAVADAQGDLADIAGAAPIEDFEADSVIPRLPSSSECMTIDVQFFGRAPKVFPPPFLCTFFGVFKLALGFLLYAFTALSIVRLVLGAN